MSTPADAVKAAEPAPAANTVDPLPEPPPPDATALSALKSLKVQLIGAALLFVTILGLYWAASHK
jgi:hypothetical protein